MKTMTPKQRAANQANGAKGGRPKGSLPKEEIAARKAVRSVMREEYLKAEKRIVARTIHLAENAFSEGVSLNACHDILEIAARKAVRSVMRAQYLKAEKRIVARTIHLAENAFSEGVSLNACHDIL